VLRQRLQRLSLRTRGEGFTNITAALNGEIAASGLRQGLATLVCLHTSCSHLVVLLAKRTITEADADRFVAATAAARCQELPALAPYRQMIQVDLIEGPRAAEIERWSSNQLYIALGNLMTSAALLGIDTCPIEGFSPADYDRILGLEGGAFRSRVVCACGYRSDNDKYASLPKVRYPASELIEHR
jgi:nitroreductase